VSRDRRHGSWLRVPNGSAELRRLGRLALDRLELEQKPSHPTRPADLRLDDAIRV
jgi:hypothetical protein